MTSRSILQPWFERTWSFDFPTELYPSLLERLRGTPARLEEALLNLPPATLTHSPSGEWSLQRHAGHLITLEDLFLARFDEFMSGAKTLQAADVTNSATYAANHDAVPLAEILKRFRSKRSSYVQRLDTLHPTDFARTALHPRLQTPMRLVDMCLFHADHDDHHLAIIQRIKKKQLDIAMTKTARDS